MMPKLIAFARRRVIGSMPSIGTPNTSRRRARVDVLAVGETFPQHRQIGDMRQQPQLDLRVIRADQHVPRFGDERVADAAAFLRADRDVLQIRIGRRQPPGRGDRHRERRMHPPGLRIDLVHQRIGIGAISASPAAAIPGCVSAVPCPCSASACSTEESVPQAPVFIRLPPGSFCSSNSTSPSCFGLPTLNGWPARRWQSCSITAMRRFEIDRHAPQVVGIDLDPGAFHLQQDRHQPPLHLLVQRQAAVQAQPGPQRFPQPQRDIGVFRRHRRWRGRSAPGRRARGCGRSR